MTWRRIWYSPFPGAAARAVMRKISWGRTEILYRDLDGKCRRTREWFPSPDTMVLRREPRPMVDGKHRR